MRLIAQTFKPALASAALLWSLTASAAVVTVLPSNTTWGTLGNSNGGSSAITGTMPRTVSETGSLELTGDRTRFTGLGNPFSSASSLGLLSQVTAFGFDWMVALGSTNTLNPEYSPALRLHIWDGTRRSELIWEAAYNGFYGTTAAGTWNSSGTNGLFTRFESAPVNSPTFQPIGGAQVWQTISDWSSGSSNNGTDWYSDNAYVVAISVGVGGGGATANYKAFADNVVFNINGNNRTFNFEVREQVTAVPEPGSLALVGLALAGLGFARRLRA